MASRQQGKVQVVIKQETGNNTKQDLFKEEASVFRLTMMQLINGILKQKIKHEEDKKNTVTLQYRFV